MSRKLGTVPLTYGGRLLPVLGALGPSLKCAYDGGKRRRVLSNTPPFVFASGSKPFLSLRGEWAAAFEALS